MYTTAYLLLNLADLQSPKRKITVRCISSTTLGWKPWGVSCSAYLPQRHTDWKLILSGVRSNNTSTLLRKPALNSSVLNERWTKDTNNLVYSSSANLRLTLLFAFCSWRLVMLLSRSWKRCEVGFRTAFGALEEYFLTRGEDPDCWLHTKITWFPLRRDYYTTLVFSRVTMLYL